MRDGDVHLIDANIMWSPLTGYRRDPTLAGKVLVEHHDQEPTRYYDHRIKVGACMFWSKGTESSRITDLFRYVTVMTIRDQISPAEAHRALSVIPEYRAIMAPSFPRLKDGEREATDARRS